MLVQMSIPIHCHPKYAKNKIYSKLWSHQIYNNKYVWIIPFYIYLIFQVLLVSNRWLWFTKLINSNLSSCNQLLYFLAFSCIFCFVFHRFTKLFYFIFGPVPRSYNHVIWSSDKCLWSGCDLAVICMIRWSTMICLWSVWSDCLTELMFVFGVFHIYIF